MTQQDDITQRVLSFDERERILCQFIGEPINHDRKMAVAIETAVLSKLRAPVADEHCSACNPQVFSVEQLEKDPLLVARLWRKPADTDGSLVERILEHVSELREALSVIASAWSARTRLPEEDGIQALKDIARAALASAPVAGEAQPVALYQARTRPTWRTDENAWSKWEDCTAAQAADYERVPLLHDWQYEVRRLYAAPQASAEPPKPPRGWQLALGLAIDAIENAAPMGSDWPVNWPAILHGLKDLRAALSATQAGQGERDA